jgi:hypothetical protein
MKKHIVYAIAVLLSVTFLSACAKKDSSTPAPTYPSTQGVISGTGGATFSTSGTSSSFTRNVDTVIVKATIDAANGKFFSMGFIAPTVGTFNFDDAYDHILDPNYQFKGVALYFYETTQNGTLYSHEFAVKSGSYTITYASSTGITGTYTATLDDFNNNGDAPVTVSGSFSGNF